MVTAIEMTPETVVGNTIIDYPFATVFVEIVVAQPNGYPKLVFATVQVDIGGQFEMQAFRLETCVNHIGEESQILSRFNQIRIAFRALAAGPEFSAAVPNAGLGFSHDACHGENQYDV